ncbi:MAG: PAS domain-containing protein [Sphingopyxis solisilvae]|uniref:PAS domain-containing protein n=1 Tax=Sphingopyxis solisilvae TaxID=1886788 RepID=UPI0040360772
MDSMRGLLAGSHDQDDAAIDAPASVGVDERRMQVRAYNYWASLLADRAYPSVEDLDLEGADFGAHSVLLDFTAGVENPGIAFLGERLREESQIGEDVHYISQIPGRSLLSRLTDHYLQIIANRAPIGFEAEFVNDRGLTIMYRGILLPFSSDDDTIDFIMGVINWKEAAPADQEAELQLSVEQALRSAAPLTAPVPVWADGPDSEHLDDEVAADAMPGFAALAGDDAMPEPAGEAEFDPPAADAELADWLALARETAERAVAADSRSRGALYQAVAKAWDFALAAEQQPEAFAALLDDAGLKAQPRAPMTPVVKLVFGAGYDKTRLAEYACVLGHAREEGIGQGELAAYLDRYPGGLKGLVKDARARRKPDGVAPDRGDEKLAALRSAHPAIILEHDAGDAEFVVLIARTMPGGHIGIVAKAADDPALVGKLARKAVPITGG